MSDLVLKSKIGEINLNFEYLTNDIINIINNFIIKTNNCLTILFKNNENNIFKIELSENSIYKINGQEIISNVKNIYFTEDNLKYIFFKYNFFLTEIR